MAGAQLGPVIAWTLVAMLCHGPSGLLGRPDGQVDFAEGGNGRRLRQAELSSLEVPPGFAGPLAQLQRLLSNQGQAGRETATDFLRRTFESQGMVQQVWQLFVTVRRLSTQSCGAVCRE